MKDVSEAITRVRAITFSAILPFIWMARKSNDDLGDVAHGQDIVWLEWSNQCPPSPTDVFQIKTIPQYQTVERYMSLDAISLNDREHTCAAVAARIVDGEIIFAKVGSGCLWGMIPRE